MKNEPLITYDHIEDDSTSGHKLRKVEDKDEHYPISLYMLLVVDAILISAIIFMTVKIIF